MDMSASAITVYMGISQKMRLFLERGNLEAWLDDLIDVLYYYYQYLLNHNSRAHIIAAKAHLYLRGEVRH